MHARLRSDTESLTRLYFRRVFSFEKENSARNNIFESQTDFLIFPILGWYERENEL